MNALVCDKCKSTAKVVNPNWSQPQVAVKGWRQLIVSNLNMHLCPKCSDEFFKWLGFKVNATSQKEELK